MKKPRRVACRSSSLFLGLCDTCDKPHSHAAYSAKDLTATHAYTRQLASIAHQCIVNDAYVLECTHGTSLGSWAYACAGIACDRRVHRASSELLRSKPTVTNCIPAMAQTNPETAAAVDPDVSAASGAGAGPVEGPSAVGGAGKGEGKAEKRLQ